MNKKDIERFIEEMSGEKIYFDYFFEDETNQYASVTAMARIFYTKNKTIIKLNSYWFDDNNRIVKRSKTPKEVETKVHLLHEIGHVKTSTYKISDYNRNQAMGEYLAHMWAIQKAKELKMEEVKNRLEEIIRRWERWNWNKDKHNRRYIKASQIYRINKTIPYLTHYHPL